jgi:hypothetical protein
VVLFIVMAGHAVEEGSSLLLDSLIGTGFGPELGDLQAAYRYGAVKYDVRRRRCCGGEYSISKLRQCGVWNLFFFFLLLPLVGDSFESSRPLPLAQSWPD